MVDEKKLRMPAVIDTVSGHHFDFLHPEKSTFDIGDIAHALSHVCRFAGHCRTFYSVAQHSVHVSYLVPEDDAMAGLLHDATEAFLGDVATPLKQLLPDYQELEDLVEEEIFLRFGLERHPASVKPCDLVMMATERRDLMVPVTGGAWGILDGVEPRPWTIDPWTPDVAKERFLCRYYYLKNVIGAR